MNDDWNQDEQVDDGGGQNDDAVQADDAVQNGDANNF